MQGPDGLVDVHALAKSIAKRRALGHGGHGGLEEFHDGGANDVRSVLNCSKKKKKKKKSIRSSS